MAIKEPESLDGFLERLAAANDLYPPELLRVLTAADLSGCPSSAFLMIAPDPLIVDRIVRLSGLDPDGVKRATLLRFGGGLPLRFDGFDPRRRHSFRQVVAQGWFPSFGTQVCATCLADDGIWQLQWRLPIVAACGRHRTFLTTHCAGCGQRFRTHRHAPLRPVAGPEQPCGNPVGLRNPCRHPVVEHTPEAAPPAVIDTTNTIVQALAGQCVPVLGASCDPRVFLAEIRHLATLLLHLLSRPEGPLVALWATDLRLEAARRTTSLRGPRWGISPPESAVVRGHVLAEAHRILDQPGTEEAASLLVPWLDCIADIANGPAAWLVNRTTRSTTMERLIRAATSRRHHVGRRLTTVRGNRALRLSAIPQLMDSDTYHEFFAAMLGGYEWTGRLYSSLCVVRSVTSVSNWPDAAAAIGVDPDLGVRTARAASTRMRASPTAFTAAVDHVSYLLPASRNYRHREARVRALAEEPDSWFDSWRTSMSPARRSTSLPYAITWMWCEVAQGLLDTSPAWPRPPARARKASYRAFRDSLPAAAQDGLRRRVIDQAPG